MKLPLKYPIWQTVKALLWWIASLGRKEEHEQD